MEFYFISGDLIEVKRIADQMYEDYKESLNHQLDLQNIRLLINAAEKMCFTNQFERGVDLILITIKHLEKMQDKSEAIKDLSKAQLLCAAGYFALKEYKIAAKYSEMSYQANKSTDQPLFIACVSYKKLGDYDKVEEISQILKGKISEDTLKNIEKSFKAFKYMFIYTNVYQKQVDQILKSEAQLDQEDKNSGRKIINLKNEVDRISNYMKNRNYEEGIKFYTKILQQLDPKFDFFKKLQVMDLISKFYFKQKQFSKALEILLDIHQQLLEKRNYLIINDFITYDNFTFIFANYLENKDYDKAAQWFKKCHSFLLLNGYFTEFDNQRCLFILHYIQCLFNIENFDEALEYTKLFERYLDQFQQEKQYIELYNQLINARISILDKCQNQEMIQKELEKYYQFLLPIKNQEIQQFYLCITNLIRTFQKTNNNEGLVKYGLEYLKVRPQFEKEEDFLHQRCIVYYQLILNCMNTGQFELANKLIVESQSCFLKQKDYLYLYHILLFQIVLDINFNKYECVDNSIRNAENFLSQYFVGHQNEKEMRALGYQAISSAYFKLRDYQKSFEYIEKYVSLGCSSQQDKEKQKVLIDNLLKIEEFKEKTENMISQYGLNKESKQ
ncbi:hypothetical protein TTHERM_00073160 (macronuclear) [Tetrahymena thermophila SB210]|uniref:Tetratricopeptide repeat protein n=1 Tax=Tetrahymena thermophila (strain SB210) TaxID=312017 RepID=Q23GF0_TETTS|nr:hypothetical protein TTHERM_00073160 [Tetrahymena thermophila SB210]EAR95310.2 hypothetical protein TTHERM_00073160 [Tetrahymena thermophila SB210]|eukprot:XP_001015555.2 hypothetical protein TTHERM_00073160 [Tetrahymena thermophila SB210]